MASVGTARLHLIVDATTPREAIEAAVDGGVDAVHLRDHAADAATLYARGLALRAALGRRTGLIVNDRVDVALAIGADGVQLGRRSMPIAAARRVAPTLPIGSSVHDVAAAVEAEQAGAAWLLVGTIYRTPSHPGEPGAGPDLIARVRTRCERPIVAIGGVASSNAAACRDAGANGVAVITAILGATDPRAASAAIRREVDR